MDNSSPEKTITAMREAAATLESKGVVDRQFPDLYNTFSDPPLYTVSLSEVSKPTFVKNSIAFPTLGLESIKQYVPNSPCGIVLSINRAYFVVGNCLYIWNYEDSQDIVIQEEADPIVGVGFVKPKPGIFVDEVKQLLVIATTKEIRLLGVTYSLTNGLKLYEPNMRVSATGVSMVQIVGTKFGRIFMLGSDQNVWELAYRRDESWFVSRCSKKLHTSGSSWSYLFSGPQEPVIQIAVSENGTALYQLTKNSTIYVSNLGTDNTTFTTVCHKSDTLADAKRTSPLSSHLNDDFQIVSIHPTSASESLHYHLVAVTATGCRIYYSHHKDNQLLNCDAPPNGLVTMYVRTPSNEAALSDRIGKALYQDTFFMFVKNPEASASQSRIATYSPDLSSLSGRYLSTSKVNLSEFHNEMDVHGKVLAIVESHTSSYKINEMASPYNSPARHFLVLTTSGISVLVKRRPVDILYKLLELSGEDTCRRPGDFNSFFAHFGYLNSTALCFSLIDSDSSRTVKNSSMCSAPPVSNAISQGAKYLLERNGNVPSELLEADGTQYTSRHDGLALFIYRTISSVWTKQMVKEVVKNDVKTYANNVPAEDLRNVRLALDSIVRFIDRNTNLFPVTTTTKEDASLNNIRTFIIYLAQAITFFGYISEIGVDSVVKLMKPNALAQFLEKDLKSLVTTAEGKSIVNELSSAVISHTFTRSNSTSYVIDILTQKCGSFCGANDVLLYAAAQQISSANYANPSQAKATLTDALKTLTRIARHIPADKASEIANEFVARHYPAYGIRLSLTCSEARDPNHDTNAIVEAGPSQQESRVALFQAKQPFYDIVVNILCNAVKTMQNDSLFLKELFLEAFNKNDKAFRYYAYEKLVQNQLGKDLIEQAPPYLEEFLKSSPPQYDRYKLLADYYRQSQRFEEAAYTYAKLIDISENGLPFNTLIDILATARTCAKSVSAPTKQYNMHQLIQRIDTRLEEARKLTAQT